MKFLKDIAMIRAGIPFREKVEAVTGGRYRLVQIKDVHQDRGLLAESLMAIHVPDVREDHLLRPGDVLLAARGTRNHATLFPANFPNTLAGSQLFIIQPRKDILPEYLVWYLNQRAAQQHIEANLAGSFVRFVPKEALNELQVPVPPLEEQRKIVTIHELAMKEHQLLDAIKEKRRRLVEIALRQTIQRGKY